MLLVKIAADESRMAGLSLIRKLLISVHRRSENLVGSVIVGMKLWAINVWKNSRACIFVFTLRRSMLKSPAIITS